MQLILSRLGTEKKIRSNEQRVDRFARSVVNQRHTLSQHELRLKQTTQQLEKMFFDIDRFRTILLLQLIKTPIFLNYETEISCLMIFSHNFHLVD